MENKVLAFLRREGLLAPGDRVTCAVSGGPDSMALLWCLYLLREKLDIRLSAAHFDHGLRPESGAEAQMVRDFCLSHGIPVTIGRGTIASRGRGLEAAAREARYAFLLDAAGDGKLATAHNAQDNAETVLLHLLRGTSLRGLGGIPARRGNIIRPLLSVTREEILDFLAAWSIPFCHDGSNDGDLYLRNRVRHQILPFFLQENPRFLSGTLQLSQTLRQEDALLSQLAAQALEDCRREGGLSVPALTALHPALCRRVLAAFLTELGLAEPQDFQIRQAQALIASKNPGAETSFSGGLRLRRAYDLLTAACPQGPFAPVFLSDQTYVTLPGWEVSCTLLPKNTQPETNRFTFILQCDILKLDGLCLRPRRTGDRLRLPGGSKEVSRLMTDRKLPRARRDSLPLLAWNSGILAAPFLGADPNWIPPAGAPAVKIEFKEI